MTEAPTRKTGNKCNNYIMYYIHERTTGFVEFVNMIIACIICTEGLR
jgi:hypothetical protein